MRERVLSTRRIFDGKILRLRVDDVEAADGHRGTREVIEHPGAVGAVVVDGEDLVLVRQYRHATGRELLEIPAGKLDPGEDPETCIRRELVEEVGLAPAGVEHLASFYTTPGFSDEIFHLYYCDRHTPADGSTDPGEVLEVERVPLSRVRELLTDDRVDAKTLVGLAYLLSRGA